MNFTFFQTTYRLYYFFHSNFILELITLLDPNVCQMLRIWSLKFIYYINGHPSMQIVTDLVLMSNGRKKRAVNPLLFTSRASHTRV